ncbi:smad nuclear-interacting protein 1-like [Planococcus citri]|uniref:smad nuclear-interacting protein 1-like n=1 Tax=Planococcus citri TaxID=170843 RepID=UPI0031F7CF48
MSSRPNHRRSRDRSRDRHSHDRHDSADRDRHRHKQERNFRDDKKEPVWGKPENSPAKEPKKEKEKPNFQTTGKLAEETNTFRGVVIKYSEPPEARIPKRRWRLYPFKGEKALPVLYIHRQSGYLMGRDRKIADIALDHPSCSKQHTAFQFRLVPFKRDDGSTAQRVRPYIMDLESANGTFINNKKVEPKRYYELFEKDVLKFGFSSREYVLLHEHSKDSDEDDNMKEEPGTKKKSC